MENSSSKLPVSSILAQTSYDSIIDFLSEGTTGTHDVGEKEWAVFHEVGGFASADVSAFAIPEAQVVDGRIFPMTLGPRRRASLGGTTRGAANRLAFVRAERNKILQLVKTHGAVLLRGWGAATPEDFSELGIALHGEDAFNMKCSAGPRTEVSPGVFTSNEAPASERIPFHHEMAQCSSPPEHIAFFCQVPAASGGSTPIIFSHLVASFLRRAHPAFAEKLAELGVRYVRVMPGETDSSSALGKSWRVSLGVQTREEAEATLAKPCSEYEDYEWLDGGFLRTVSKVGPALVLEEASGREVFFTAAETTLNADPHGRGAGGEQRPVKAIVFGDRSQLSPAELAALTNVGEYMLRAQVAFRWQEGDALLLNNATVMHSRESFSPPRRILAALSGKMTKVPVLRAVPTSH